MTPKKAAPRKKSTASEPKFEKDLERLEGIVHALEEGGLPLDESLKKFEEGISLSKRCEKALSAAEKKIEVLTKDAGGKVKAEAFEDGEEDDEEETEEDEDDESDDDGLLF
jgi:exodeoxyribonuclease VII small subunit